MEIREENPAEYVRTPLPKRRIEEGTSTPEDCAQTICDTKRKFNFIGEKKGFILPVCQQNPYLANWLTTYENMPEDFQNEALTLLVTRCKRPQIRHLHTVIKPYFQVDFLQHLPKELSLKILGYLEPRHLIMAATISRTWCHLAEDNVLWAKKCQQFVISEFFPPSLARSENWELFSDREVIVDTPDTPSTYLMSIKHERQYPISKMSSIAPADIEIVEQSEASSKTMNVNFNFPLLSCLERSRWKAIYLRNKRISNNWRFRHPNAICHLRGHDEHVITCLKLRGERIITGSDDCTLRVWSVATGRCTQVLNGHVGGVWALQLSKDGKIAISGSTDRTVRVWNTETGELLHTLNGHTSTVRCMSLRGNILITGSRDSTIRMWDIAEGKCIRSFIGHLAAVRCVKFDGITIVSGAYDNKINVWNSAEGTLEHVLQGHRDRVYSLHFDSERGLVISGSLDTTIRVWNVRTGECLQTLIGHQSLTSGMKLRENFLVSANADSTIKVWNILDGTCIHTLAGPNKHASAVTGLRFLENGLIATSGDDGTVKLWDIYQGEFVCDLVTLKSSGSGGCVWRMKIAPTLFLCAVGSRNGTEDTKLILMDFDAPYP